MMAAPPPKSPMTAYIKALPKSTAKWLVLARALATDPTPLVSAFEETAIAYFDYDNLRPFSPGRSRGYLPGCGKTERVAAALERRGRAPWEVADAPTLDFVYLDREIVPAAGHARADVTKIDVVLATARRGRPASQGRAIIGEIKTATDTDSLRALLQALGGAAQLSGPLQRARIGLWCSRPDFVVAHDRPDIYVILVNRRDDAALPLAKTVRDKLLKTPGVKERVRRIEFLHLTCEDRGKINSIERA